jgi:histone H3/H4
MADLLVVRSKVKEYVKGKKCRMSEEAVVAVSAAVKGLLDKAALRAKGNKRQTLKAVDL